MTIKFKVTHGNPSFMRKSEALSQTLKALLLLFSISLLFQQYLFNIFKVGYFLPLNKLRHQKAE